MVNDLVNNATNIREEKQNLEIAFAPIENPNGTLEYIAIQDIGNLHLETPLLQSASSPAEPDRNNLFNAVYIGSITVLGLFVLFRILQKTK